MKIKRFLKSIQKIQLNYPDIHYPTLKVILQEFSLCLNPREHLCHDIMITHLSEFSSKQISITSFVNNSKIEILEQKLNKIKGGKSNDKKQIEF